MPERYPGRPEQYDDYWLWERWMLGHAEFKRYGPKNWAHRPAHLPKPAPASWRAAHKRRFGTPVVPKPPPPAPVTKPSIFAERGMFLAWNPLVALQYGGLVDWVAVQAEGRMQDGTPWTTPETVAKLRAAGFRVHVWEAAVTEGESALARLGADGGYIGQSESAKQFTDCMDLGGPFERERAMVSNVTFLADSPSAWPNDWTCLPEAYANANPNATVEKMHYEAYKRGAKKIYPCFGCYDASAEQPGVGTRIALRAYLFAWSRLGLAGWNEYLGETLTPDDAAALAGH